MTRQPNAVDFWHWFALTTIFVDRIPGLVYLFALYPGQRVDFGRRRSVCIPGGLVAAQENVVVIRFFEAMQIINRVEAESHFSGSSANPAR